jgi:hypothetical protein
MAEGSPAWIQLRLVPVNDPARLFFVFLRVMRHHFLQPQRFVAFQTARGKANHLAAFLDGEIDFIQQEINLFNVIPWDENQL